MKIRDRIIDGIRLGDVPEGPFDKINTISRAANAEGSVLLKNDGMLPLKKGDKIAVFGRVQREYYKSGTGSGGKVNTQYVTNIFDSLKKSGDVVINEEVSETYAKWCEKKPFDIGNGWNQPWSQKEMPLTEELCKNAAAVSDKAIVIIGRTAGEDTDNSADKGSYNLSDGEYDMLKKVSDAFDKVCVVLNVGNILDMKWVEELYISAVLYIWHGGQEGGAAAADLLLGKSFPSGKLSDTIVYNIEDYPSFEGFSNYDENVYSEDIFVGYRYFETFAKEKVMYPFGFGIGYTEFEIKTLSAELENDTLFVKTEVKNIGKFAGKETVQIYCGGERKKLCCPSRELKAFKKTRELKPGEVETLDFEIDINEFAGYDDTGVTGNKSCYVLEKGEYIIYAGTDVRSAAKVFAFDVPETIVVKRCEALFALDRDMKRMINLGGKAEFETLKAVPKKRERLVLKEFSKSSKQKIKLSDVYNKKAELNDFIAQLSDLELAVLGQGEGMNSPKVRGGTGGTIGGMIPELQELDVPAICVTDGPSGLRFDNGDFATSMPNGTMLACTWNIELVKKLYSYEGIEAYANHVDALLGPGMNIHRIPLCGRNFEYFSEDPYLSGKMGSAVCEGLYSAGVTGTIKHFAANNKERNRVQINMVISERALREIYLKPYEIAVGSGCVNMLMTAYNRINGVYCSANYDLNTDVLRKEWGYDGLVMTDWWPKSYIDSDGKGAVDRAMSVSAQNDVYMVNADAEEAARAVLEKGTATRAELQRNAANICRVIMQTPTFERMLAGETIGMGKEINVEKMQLVLSKEGIKSGDEIEVNCAKSGEFAIEVEYSSDKSELMQIPIKVFGDGQCSSLMALLMLTGTNGQDKKCTVSTYLLQGDQKLRPEFLDENAQIKCFKLFKAADK